MLRAPVPHTRSCYRWAQRPRACFTAQPFTLFTLRLCPPLLPVREAGEVEEESGAAVQGQGQDGAGGSGAFSSLPLAVAVAVRRARAVNCCFDQTIRRII